MHSRTYKEGRMAAAVRSLVARTLDRRRRSGGAAAAGCFSVYVGAGRERFAVPVERANHPLFRRLLDDAQREYGYAAQGPLALPGCDVAAFVGVLWRMEHDDEEEEDGEDLHVVIVADVRFDPRRCDGRVHRTLSPTPRSCRRRWWL